MAGAMEGVRRSLAHVLAPLAIVAFTLALALVLLQGRGGEADAPATPAGQVQQEQAQSEREAAEERRERRERREQQEEGATYEVRAGDTLSSIAAEAGVDVDELQAENPDLDAQNLSPGQEIRLPE